MPLSEGLRYLRGVVVSTVTSDERDIRSEQSKYRRVATGIQTLERIRCLRSTMHMNGSAGLLATRF